MRICLCFLYYEIPGLSFLIASSGDALVWFELKNKSLLGPIYSQMKSGTRFQALETSMGRNPRSFCCVKILESEDIFCACFAGATPVNADPMWREQLLRSPKLTRKR